MADLSEKEKQFLAQNKSRPDARQVDSRQAFLDKQFQRFGIVAVFLFPLVTFLAFRAQDILPFFFGEASNIMVLPFQIIIWGLIFICFDSLLLKTALFINRKEIVFLSFLILILYAVVLNLCLIPVYRLAGIGIATLVSLAAMFGFAVFYLTRIGIKFPFYQSCEKPAIAAMGMTLILHYTSMWSFPLALFSGIFGYLMILMIVITLEK